MVTSSVAFSLIYMVFTGIFIITSKAIPATYNLPWFYVARSETAIGYLPWFVAYLDRHLIFSMTLEAMFLTFIISVLVGISTVLLLYRFGPESKNTTCKKSKGVFGFFGLIPAFLSLFACCGGGILVMIFGAGIIASLFPYGYTFGLASIVLLVIGILFSTKDLKKSAVLKN